MNPGVSEEPDDVCLVSHQRDVCGRLRDGHTHQLIRRNEAELCRRDDLCSAVGRRQDSGVHVG